MTKDQISISIILTLTLIFFAWGKWRYDIVSMFALIVATLLGLVDKHKMFAGFGHPAVITVAAVLIISNALQQSGTLEIITNWLKKFGKNSSLQLLLLTSLVAITSGFMNNVGALALFLPIAISLAKRNKTSPGAMLMPISFASLLGGLITLIGTPPNIIIAQYLKEETGRSFNMFDFTPVGLVVSFVGVIYISFLGWKLIPIRQAEKTDTIVSVSEYMTELHIPAGNDFIGRSLFRILKLCEGEEIRILSIIRGERRILAPTQYEILKQDDILVVEGHTDCIQQLIEESGLEMIDGEVDTLKLSSEKVMIIEVIVGTGSLMTGRSAERLHLSTNHGINLMAISRQGQSITQRLHKTIIRTGDVLLLQTDGSGLSDKLDYLGCLPLAERQINLGKTKKVWKTAIIFALSILVTAFSPLPSYLTFTSAVGLLVITNVINVRDLYNSIEWPIIVLLASMIPVGGALQTTGMTDVIAHSIIHLTNGVPIYVLLGLLMLVCMLLSDVINNAATAIIMAPIGAAIASTLGYHVEPFLMTVCVGASSTFLTPIGHQSNLLVMSPGGYRFSDYARVGWILDILIILTAVPTILYFWKL